MKPLETLLIANRGEVAIRIARAAGELGVRTVAVYSKDDTSSLHVRMADEAIELAGVGPSAYLDMESIVAAARRSGCDAVHPGYGFLSENAQFARRCVAAGLTFVGPTPEVLATLGDKTRARELARELEVPVLNGTLHATSLQEAKEFFATLASGSAMMVKAIHGGGGRGMRIVRSAEEIDDAYARCQSEAIGAFGRGDLYVERLVPRARHIEVQIIGDGTGQVTHLWDRECTLQRRNQKLIECAPVTGLSTRLREAALNAAVRLAQAVKYRSLGTFEFLVDVGEDGEARSIEFMEANPRLQVEHTVTEAVTGIDLVIAQLRVASGMSLDALGLLQHHVGQPEGVAVQARVNMESMSTDGAAKPTGGIIGAFNPPSGPAVRVDTFGYTGYHTNPSFDSLLAKVIVHAPDWDYPQAIRQARRKLTEFHLEGVVTNLDFLQALLARPEVAMQRVHTRFVEEHAKDILAALKSNSRFFLAQADSSVLADIALREGPADTVPAVSSMSGTVIRVDVGIGERVAAGQQVAVIEAMKMEHLVTAPVSGVVREVAVSAGAMIYEGDPLLFVEGAQVAEVTTCQEAEPDPDHVRADLAEVLQRRFELTDAAREDAVAKRRAKGQRTARENLAALFDRGEFSEYGEFALAAQRNRRSLEDLRRLSPADGLVTGVGQVNGEVFGDESSRCLALAYDYTVFAGTQGHFNHTKTDRMLELAERWRLPVVLFAEGGGGRPGDTDWNGVSGFFVKTFASYAALSGLVPLVGITSGRCFAGNAALLGCSNVIIATRNATIGMGGPAMIEGGGLGVFEPEEVGPVTVQAPNGVIDLLVDDEPAAVQAARKYLSYFQGRTEPWSCEDQRILRRVVPENRVRTYDMRSCINALCDTDSVLELRRDFGSGIITALVRIEGRPFGLFANNPLHLGGAIDAEAADKATRFMQLCDAFDIPIISLCDTPGFMVGPQAEKTAQVRHVCRLFVTAASITVPFFCVVLRKAYGLGALGMAAGSSVAPFFTVSWPSGEFGSMGLEGAARLGYRKELSAIKDPVERKAFFDHKVSEAYAAGKALNAASFLEIDSVIDPRDTRAWIVRAIRSVPPVSSAAGRKRSYIDTW